MIKTLLESIPDAATFLLAAISFGMVWASRREGLFHLALGGIMICSVGVFNRADSAGLGIPTSIALATVAGAALGLAIEVSLYRVLRRRNVSGEAFLLASFGLLIILERLASIWLGTMPLSLEAHRRIAERVDFLGSQLTAIQWQTAGLASALLLLCAIVYRGDWGQRLNAMRQSGFLYDWRVGRSSMLLAVVGLISGALAAFGGALYHLQHRVLIERAAMGYIVPAFVVVLSAEGLARLLASFIPPHRRTARSERILLIPLYALMAWLLAILSQIVTRVLEPQWKDVILLGVTLVALRFGTLGRMQRQEEGVTA
jgi:branched-subunit amino acid ABC-type transport system permease component